MASVLVGAVLSVGMIILSPTVWVGVFKNPHALVGLKNTAIVSMTASSVLGWLVSVLTKEKRAEDLFEDEKLRTYQGVGAE